MRSKVFHDFESLFYNGNPAAPLDVPASWVVADLMENGKITATAQIIWDGRSKRWYCDITSVPSNGVPLFDHRGIETFNGSIDILHRAWIRLLDFPPERRRMVFAAPVDTGDEE